MAESDNFNQLSSSGLTPELASQLPDESNRRSFRSYTDPNPAFVPCAPVTQSDNQRKHTIASDSTVQSNVNIKIGGRSRREIGTIFLSKTEIINLRINLILTNTKKVQEIGETSTPALDLSKLLMRNLPTTLFTLHSLVKLNLSSNNLQSLPSEIGELINLQELIVDCNEITHLPPEISKLTSLERFHCYSNKIDFLPVEICKMTSLQRLYLGKNLISNIPREVCYLPSLKWLSLDFNNLNFLPPQIAMLNSLAYLSVESNSLNSLPKEMGDMESLEFFSLVNNPIISLPESFGKFPSLKDLRSDNLFELPKHIADKHDGREIYDYIMNIIVRFDLNFNEKVHWEPDQNSSKCAKCQSSFTFTKRRHHCRLCGLIFCHKDCDITCEIPGISSPDRCCHDCYSFVNPLSPNNLYRQNIEKKRERERKLTTIGFEDGEENLPLEEKIEKIRGQISEISMLVMKELDTKEALIKFKSIAQSSQFDDTEIEINQCDTTIDSLNNSLAYLKDLLQSLIQSEEKNNS